MTRVVLLPGLNGNADLATELEDARPADVALTVVALPMDRPRTYAELTEWVLPRLPTEPFTLVAESFSGPLGVHVAARSASVRALVLCATFVTPAAPTLLAHVPRMLLGRVPPRALVQAVLTGGDAALAERVRRALRAVPPAVIAGRVQETLRADARADLQAYAGPLLYLQGARDRLVFPHHARTIAALAPRVQIASFDSPHLVLQTHAAEAWAHIHRLGSE